jgi:hypothetical protein
MGPSLPGILRKKSKKGHRTTYLESRGRSKGMGPRVHGILRKKSRRGHRTTWNPEEGVKEGPDYLES